jgi:N utilization substance protein B
MSKKPSQRSENRQVAMQYLYAWEYNRPEVLDEAICSYLETLEQPRTYFAFAEKLIRGVVLNIESIDKEIQQLAKNWSFERIARVDLAILRLAIFELRHCEDIPPVVTINEAVELSKSFSEDDSKRFINGILDKIKDSLTRPFRQAAGGSKPDKNVLDGLID